MKLIDELVEAYLNGNEENIYAYNEEAKEVFIIEANPDEYNDLVVIPHMTSSEAYRLMVQFAEQQEEKISNELLEVLNRNKPFRSFKDQIKGQDIENAWYEFENNYAEGKMTEWLAQVP